MSINAIDANKRSFTNYSDPVHQYIGKIDKLIENAIAEGLFEVEIPVPYHCRDALINYYSDLRYSVTMLKPLSLLTLKWDTQSLKRNQ